MRIRIKDNPVVCGPGADTDKYRKRLKALAGQWLEVETEHCFGDQFNCPPESEDHENGLRVMLSNVAAVEDDVRPGAVKCLYCGYQQLDTADEDVMSDCPRCAYKAGDGEVAYVNNDLCVMDRIRPLQTMVDGQHQVIYYNRRVRKVKTPEGEVRVYGDERRPLAARR